MKSFKSEETQGTIKKITGRVKEATGILTANRTLEEKGAQQRAEGAVQESLGKTRRQVGEIVEGLAKAIKN